MKRLKKFILIILTTAMVTGIGFYFYNSKDVFLAYKNSDDNPDMTTKEGVDSDEHAQNNMFTKIKLDYIANNPDLYPESLVSLIDRNPEILDFVYNYPFQHNSTFNTDITADVNNANGDVPYFCQFDSRWGYMDYGTGVVGYTGCGPVALSMVAVYLTGDLTYSPDYVVQYAIDNGYCIPGNGTAWSLMYEGCNNFGITSYELNNSKYDMENALDNGEVIICLMGPGDFTTEGHFIVIKGYTDSGFLINDPFSLERTNKIWDYNTIENQITSMWAFY